MTTTQSTALSFREAVAEEIRAVMGRRRMSGAQLAKRLGVSQAWVWRRTSGEVAFNLDEVEAIAKVLRVDPMDLMPRSAPNSQAGSGINMRS